MSKNQNEHIVNAFDQVASQAVFNGVSDEAVGEGEIVSFMHRSSAMDTRLTKFMTTVRKWVNQHTGTSQVLLKSFDEDLRDGIILIALLEKLSGVTLAHNEVAANEQSRRENLTVAFDFITQGLGLEPGDRWSVEGLLGQDSMPEVLALLGDLAEYYNCGEEIYSGLNLAWVTKKKVKGVVETKTKTFVITTDKETSKKLNDVRRQKTKRRPPSSMPAAYRFADQVEGTIEQTFAKQEKLENDVRNFINVNLEPMNIKLKNLAEQLSDGTVLLFMIGILGRFFVQMSKYYLVPADDVQKLHNVNLAIDLMEDMGFDRGEINAKAIVAKDTRAILTPFALLMQTFHTTAAVEDI